MAYNGYKSYVALQLLSGGFSSAAPSSDATDTLLFDSFTTDVSFNEMMCKPIANSRLEQDKKYGTEEVKVGIEFPAILGQKALLYVYKNIFGAGYSKDLVSGETSIWDYTFYPADFEDDNYLSVENFKAGSLYKYYPVKFTTLSITSNVNEFIKFKVDGIAKQAVAPASTSVTPTFAELCGLKFDQVSLTIGGTDYPVTNFEISVDMNEKQDYALGSNTAVRIAPQDIINPVSIKIGLLDYNQTLYENYIQHQSASLSIIVTGDEISGSSVPTNYKLEISVPYMVWDNAKADINGGSPLKSDLEFKGLYNSDGSTDADKAPIKIIITSDADV